MDRITREDDYTRWYLRDAERTVHSEVYEGRYHHHRRIRVVASLLRRLGIKRIVDVGCGDGWQSRVLTRVGFEVIGTDISGTRLARARHDSQGETKLFASDMRMPAIRRQRLECIYLGQVVEHLPDPQEVLENLRETLRPGGYLVLDTPCRDNLVDDLIRILGLSRRFPGVLDWGAQIDPGHLRFFTREEIHALLLGAGYEVVCSRGAPRLRWNIPRIGNFLAAHKRLWRLHDLVENLLGLIPRYRRTGAVIVYVARNPHIDHLRERQPKTDSE